MPFQDRPLHPTAVTQDVSHEASNVPHKLRASWLGSWRPPWESVKGRRWGDAIWALMALSQAWLLGGSEGCWPKGQWTARRPRGPWLAEPPEHFLSRPDPRWVALLRHGSPEADPEHRGSRETELLAWCWEELIAGRGAAWMAYGSVLLEGKARADAIPLIAAVDPQGRVHAPPWAEVLIPEALRQLPPGWWEVLLRDLDATGRLLPEGPFPAEAPWTPLLARGIAVLEPLCLRELPPDLEVSRSAPWIHPLPDGGWVIDPRVRAWGRGFGACAAGLGAAQHPGLALGATPEAGLRTLLAGRPPDPAQHPTGWSLRIAADLQRSLPPPPCPPPSGEPTWDRLRMRWQPEEALPAPGYPLWGAVAHPCADPFHWMAEGLRAFRLQRFEGALRAFAWAQAHFERLDAPFWASRAAANAASAALNWGDLRGSEVWRDLAGEPLPQLREMDAITLLAMRTEYEEALTRLRALLETHPEMPEAWATLLDLGLALDRRSLVEEALRHVSGPLQALGTAWLTNRLAAIPPDLDHEHALMWAHYRSRRGQETPESFWTAWGACPNALLRLEVGLARLERHPGEALAARLLELQAIADRAESPRHQARLRPFWPKFAPGPAPDPRCVLEAWLAAGRSPAWILWPQGSGDLERLGRGLSPPEPLLSRLRQDGGLAPVESEGWIWQGIPMVWEGAPVGFLLQATPPDAPFPPIEDAAILAPWLAALTVPAPAAPLETIGNLLFDGSEPMATLVRELDRVAPSELPVLILGPTGSGKELVARELHARSGRPGALVAVNCSALAENLLESELFGHLKGAFTGADRDRPGAIESAHEGTLFLDEIADISPRIQSMFLRVLQEREVRRVGADKARRVDVRFLAATHKPLEELAASGGFRRDLLFRLQGTVLRLPSLDERRHEFPFLVPRLVAQVAHEARRTCPALAPGLPQALARVSWPGNFRQIRHAIERALLRCGETPLKAEHFPELDCPELEARTWIEATRAFQRRLLLEYLKRHRFQATEAARSLGLTRPALYLAARRVGLDIVAARLRWESEQAPRG